jgi:sugar fermentation stimulation protein A
MSSKFGSIFIMKYEKVVKGKFIERPNRFIATVSIDGREDFAHVKNTGRCKELLIDGATVYLEDHKDHMGKRKMRYSLIGVEKETSYGNLMINIDSQAPNKVVGEALACGYIRLKGMNSLTDIKPEAIYGNSRIDFRVRDCDGKEAYIEIKGVTLESGGIASFPDAPTERGIKHLLELENAVKDGKAAFAVFVIQMKGVKLFRPNDDRHKAFGDALRHANNNGVEVLAFDCFVSEDKLILGKEIKVDLGEY